MSMEWPQGKYGAILADPPWAFRTWAGSAVPSRVADAHYQTMSMKQIAKLPVAELAADDCALFLWCCWPTLPEALGIINAWGFEYKTCGFDWVKANNTQPDFFEEQLRGQVGMGYWTRANSEPCLLATRGKPKRLNADVRQAIIEPRRQHSRKPDCVHGRIERLVSGPYVELFARAPREGWAVWGNETDKFAGAA